MAPILISMLTMRVLAKLMTMPTMLVAMLMMMAMRVVM